VAAFLDGVIGALHPSISMPAFCGGRDQEGRYTSGPSPHYIYRKINETGMSARQRHLEQF
jgi:hypothetical protein